MTPADRTAAGRPIIPIERKGPWRQLVDLLRANGSFRGFCEFALIGAIVLVFLHGLNLRVFDIWSALVPQTSSAGTQSDDRASPSVKALAALGEGDGRSLATRLPPIPRLSEVVFDQSYFAAVVEPLRTQFVEATRAYQAHDYRRVLELLAGADQRDPRVMLVRGVALVGLADIEDFQSGADLLRQASDLGEPKAMAILGVMKMVGYFGVGLDIDGGRRLLERASAAGDAAAARIIGVGYSNGFSGSIDLQRAATYLRVAADRHDLIATLLLARMLAAGTGVPKDEVESGRLMLVAAEGGNADAQVSVGLASLRGFLGGLTADPKPALAWLERAAAQGDPRGEYALGVFYLIIKPELGYSDPPRGAELLRQCAQVSLDSECSFAYGQALAIGQGVARDSVKAYAFYRLSEDLHPSVKSRERLAALASLISPAEVVQAQSLAIAMREEAERAKQVSPAAR